MGEKLLIFGGTEDGRYLAETLAARGFSVTLSVATDYGRAQVSDVPGLTVRAGRLPPEEMRELMRGGGFDRVIDATHPYAAQVTAHIREAAAECSLPYVRMVRPSTAETEEGWIWTDSPKGAADYLAGVEGKVLLTTGSKDLDVFASVPGYQERLYPRILPNLDSLTRALELGYPGKHIICMQGPFSEELNTALLRQIGAKVMVTKDTGAAGGFDEKVRAARAAGAALVVIGRPVEEEGPTAEELLAALCAKEEER